MMPPGGFPKCETTGIMLEKQSDMTPTASFRPSSQCDSEFSCETDAGYLKNQPQVDTMYMFIVSGGAKRERDYFRILASNENPRLKLIFVSDKSQGLTPRQMRDLTYEAIVEKSFIDFSGRYVSMADNDLIYLVSDVDQFGEDLIEFIKDKKDGVSWVISNPAFEIWLFYHYYDSPSELIQAKNVALAKRSKWLKNRLDTLRKGGINPVEASLKITRAIENSISNYSEMDNGLPSLFSTQMHNLAKDILSILDDDFAKMIIQRTSRAQQFISSMK